MKRERERERERERRERREREREGGREREGLVLSTDCIPGFGIGRRARNIKAKVKTSKFQF